MTFTAFLCGGIVSAGSPPRLFSTAIAVLFSCCIGSPAHGQSPETNASPAVSGGGYASAAPGDGGEPAVFETTLRDPTRGERAIQLRILYPEAESIPALPVPVVIFSHGLGGTCRSSEFLGEHWAGRGYAVVFPQHPGSDESVWKEVPRQQRPRAFIRAASPKNAQDRVLDIHLVLEALERWAVSDDHPLSGRIDPLRVGMSGHSFGALTTQTLCGQTNPDGVQFPCPRRVRAAISMSPAMPQQPDVAAALSNVRIPWLMMTGSKDHSPLGNLTPELRKQVFNHFPAAVDHYELTLGGAHHFVFTNDELPASVPLRRPRHQQTILTISTAFWDAYLRDDPAAKHWLAGRASRSVLEAGDRWRVAIGEP